MNVKRTFSPWWLLAVIPLLALVVPLAGQYIRQAGADREYRAHVTSIRQSGYPTDVASLLQHIRETTSDENTVAWSEWMKVAFEVWQASFSAGVLKSDNGELVIETTQPEKALMDTLLEQSEPAYERLKNLSRHDGKVWLPLIWAANDMGMLWTIRTSTLPRMMRAVHEHDAKAAMEAIATQNAAMNAFDWQTSINAEIELTSALEQRDQIIIEAIEEGLFDEEQLDQLKRLVGQQADIRQRWRNVIAAERAVFLEASYRQQQTTTLDRAMGAADNGIGHLQEKAAAATRDVSVKKFARSLVRREASRKSTIEAIDRSRAAVVAQP